LKIRNLFIFRTDESCTFPIGDLVLVDDFRLLFELRSQTTDFTLYLSFEVAYFFLILSVDTLEVLDEYSLSLFVFLESFDFTCEVASLQSSLTFAFLKHMTLDVDFALCFCHIFLKVHDLLFELSRLCFA
jgi:hypothetical protein